MNPFSIIIAPFILFVSCNILIGQPDLTALDIQTDFCGSAIPVYTVTVDTWTQDDQDTYDIVFFDNGVLVQSGDALTYTAELVIADSCEPAMLPQITVEIQCTDCDGSEVVFDDVYIDNVLDFYIFPDPLLWTITETPGSCDTPAMIEITAINGDVCFSDIGEVPEYICPSTPGSEPLDYFFETLFPVGCWEIFRGTIEAECNEGCCADNGEIFINKKE